LSMHILSSEKQGLAMRLKQVEKQQTFCFRMHGSVLLIMMICFPLYLITIWIYDAFEYKSIISDADCNHQETRTSWRKTL